VRAASKRSKKIRGKATASNLNIEEKILSSLNIKWSSTNGGKARTATDPDYFLWRSD